MMKSNQVEWYNVGALESVSGLCENGLTRVPESVRNKLNHRARFIAMNSSGCEVRFHTDSPHVDVALTAFRPESDAECRVRVLRGRFSCQDVSLQPGRTYTIRLIPNAAFNATREETLNAGGFHSSIWRVVADSGYVLCIHDIQTFGYELRPPTDAETPPLNWLAYGSSITNSFLDGYPHVAAQTLGVQVQNKGLSGACHIEPELIDWMVEQCTWDFATLELGINMRMGFTPAVFTERVRYALQRFADTGKPVLVTNVYPNGKSQGHAVDPDDAATVSEAAFNQIVREEVATADRPNLRFAEGARILDDPSCLSADLLHPTAYGHARMGFNLAKVLREEIGALLPAMERC